MKKWFLLTVLVNSAHLLQAQYSSLATDVSLLRSVTKGSRFWAMGQTVQALYHIAPKTTAYAWVSYYTNGNFKNNFVALGKDSAVMPQHVGYLTRSSLRFRQVSLGFRHYFKGAYNNETTWNLYGLGGFGLLLIKASNTPSMSVDTAQYNVPQQALPGTKNVVRLTADVGLGFETLLGSGIYLYADARTWIQASRFSSPYLYNNAVPRVLILSGGVRILFE